MSEVTAPSATLAARLADYLRDQLGDERPVALDARLSGGWSVDTYAVTVGEDRLVLRVAAADHALATSPAREARIYPYAALADVPVPQVVCREEDAAWLGGPFALVTFVAGEAPNVWSPRRMAGLVEAAGAERLLGRIVEIARRIADVPLEAAVRRPPSVLGMGADEYTTVADVERWIELLDGTLLPRPGLTLAGRWLAENAPPTEAVVLQHHDFRLGNVLFDAAGDPTAVLDWEFAGAGDPLCDLGYAAQPYCLGRLLHAEPSLDLPPDPTTWMLNAYAERSGAPLERMRWFVGLGMFKMAVALLLSADLFHRGRGGEREAWLELPILSLTRDLVAAIRSMP